MAEAAKDQADAPKPLRLGVAGLGTVGGGVCKILHADAALIAARAGRPIEVTAVSARSRGTDRGFDLAPYAWEDDPEALAARADVDLVVEAMGGSDGPAKACVEAALKAGKHVVTANKALLALHGQALAEIAERSGAALRYEAAVAGAIPCVKALLEGLAANRLDRVMGVLNGTCNYILTEMERTGADYADVLADAQKLGYAEADPSLDVGGGDAAHKLALLAAVAFGTRVDFDAVQIEGIERVSLTDIAHAADMGYRIKLLGVARLSDKGLEQRMQPCLVPADSAVGQLDGVTNMTVFEGSAAGRIVLTGPGAGEGPTASAILADVIDIARGARTPPFGVPAGALREAPAAPNSEVEAAHYIRLALVDRPGALAGVAAALGAHGVSINRMRQYDHPGDGAAPVLIVSHPCRRADLDAALEAVAQLDISLDAPVALRIEDV